MKDFHVSEPKATVQQNSVGRNEKTTERLWDDEEPQEAQWKPGSELPPCIGQ